MRWISSSSNKQLIHKNSNSVSTDASSNTTSSNQLSSSHHSVIPPTPITRSPDNLATKTDFAHTTIAESELKWGRLIGKGGFSFVRKAIWTSPSTPSLSREVAVKVVDENNNDKIKNEIAMMHRLKHPNIIELFGFGIRSDFKHFIVMEFMENNSLYDVLHNDSNRTISQAQLTDWSVQLADGLAFIHSKGIAHRDLKPSNILLSKQLQVLKIADFGLVCEMTRYKLRTRVGTVFYMAPEVFIQNCNYTNACDVYSLAVTLCEMFTRQKPYDIEIRTKLKKTKPNQAWFISEISRLYAPLRPKITADVPLTLVTLIQRCWQTCDRLRPAMKEILEILRQHRRTYDELRTKSLNSFKAAIDQNQLTNDTCDTFIDGMGELKTNEMKAVSIAIVERLLDSRERLVNNKIRCEQTLTFIDQLKFINVSDSIWIYYYQSMLYWSYLQMKCHLNCDQTNSFWVRSKEKFEKIINLPMWNDETKRNSPDRMSIIRYFAFMCYRYGSVSIGDSEMVTRWIDQVRSSGQGRLNVRVWNRTKVWIEKCEMDLEMCKLRREWTSSWEQRDIYCHEQIKNLRSAALRRNKLNAKEMRHIWEAFRMKSRQGVDCYFLCDILNQLDAITIEIDDNWLCYYRRIIFHCYTILSTIIGEQNQIALQRPFTVVDFLDIKQIADRMQKKYWTLIEMCNRMSNSELYNPHTLLYIIDDIARLIDLYLNNNNAIHWKYIQKIKSATKNAISLTNSHEFTDFEMENYRCLLERVEKRLGTIN